MPDLDIHLRTATADDAAALAEFGARTFRDTFAWYNTEPDMASYLAGAFSPESQAREVADSSGLFLLAEVEGALAGYARLRRGDAPAGVVGERPLELVRFYADAPWIGRGIGSRLMEASLAVAREWDRDVAWLDVFSENPVAIAFYERWGFSVVGRQSFLLGEDVQDDLVMARALARPEPGA